jgi:hypothetical protein
MDFSFIDIKGKIIEIYLDDHTLLSKEISARFNNLRQVFDRCRRYGISLNPKKTLFGVDKGNLLGHTIYKEGI